MNLFPAADFLIACIFLLFLGATIAGALVAVFTRWIIRSVCGLALASIGLAGLFYFLNSPFLAMVQILIYVGAVCITMIFAIMLAEPDESEGESSRRSRWWNLGAVGAAGGVFWVLAGLGLSRDWPAFVVPISDGSVEQIGIALLTTQVLAFEAIALILLVAILGALAVARKGRHME